MDSKRNITSYINNSQHYNNNQFINNLYIQKTDIHR